MLTMTGDRKEMIIIKAWQSMLVNWNVGDQNPRSIPMPTTLVRLRMTTTGSPGE
ncbi:hypothetical protein D3C78_1716860 [compost metagenome]